MDTVTYDPEKLLYNIYNTLYTNAKLENVIYNDFYNEKFTDYGKIYNNIFYFTDGNSASWGVSDKAFEFSANCYFGISTDGITDTHAVTEDPLLLSPGSARVGIDTCGGYRLVKRSPCIGSGIAVSDGINTDFFGENITKNNIGAYGGSGAVPSAYMNLLAGKIPKTDFSGMSSEASAVLTDERVSTFADMTSSDLNEGAVLEYSFSIPTYLEGIWLTSEDSSLFPTDYRLEALVNGEWITVGRASDSRLPVDGETLEFYFDEVIAEGIRLTVTSAPYENGNYRIRLAEISAFSVNPTMG